IVTGKLSDLVAEHLDHLHYLNDILTINCEFLNDVLTDHLLNRLFLPLSSSLWSALNSLKIVRSTLRCPLTYCHRCFSSSTTSRWSTLWLKSSSTETCLSSHSTNHSQRRRPSLTKPPESLERSLELSCTKGAQASPETPQL
uniref:protein CLEC16A-like n=1 Tax=Oncorhynchus gorbuscha TaxID=8017 RepID=UPI001EAF8A4C